MRHLFASRVAVYRLSAEMANGAPTMTWQKVPDILDPYLGRGGELLCRLDLNFLRPGKDQLPPVTAGRAMDRIGVMFYSPSVRLLANDRITCVSGPVTGTFEIRNAPDPAVDYGSAHHFEVQVVEVAQSVKQPMRVTSGG